MQGKQSYLSSKAAPRIQFPPFYLQRNLKLVGYRGELDFGLTKEPALGLPDIDVFLRAWTLDAKPVAIMRSDVAATGAVLIEAQVVAKVQQFSSLP